MTVESNTGLSSASEDQGADEFTFNGDRTSITFLTSLPGPIVVGREAPELRYQGPEGTYTFFGKQINRLDSPLGTLLTVPLRPNADAGAINITILVPKVYGVTRESPVVFGTVAIKTTSRGFVAGPGVELTYDVLPLVGEAKVVIFIEH
jgi:hypothetical protein